jgi:hypothetical protein
MHVQRPDPFQSKYVQGDWKVQEDNQLDANIIKQAKRKI